MSEQEAYFDLTNNNIKSKLMTHKLLIRCIKKQIEKSWMYGTVNEQTIKLSELISKAIPVKSI